MPRVISLFTEAANYNMHPSTLSKYYNHRNDSALGKVQALASRLVFPRPCIEEPQK